MSSDQYELATWMNEEEEAVEGEEAEKEEDEEEEAETFSPVFCSGECLF